MASQIAVALRRRDAVGYGHGTAPFTADPTGPFGVTILRASNGCVEGRGDTLGNGWGSGFDAGTHNTGEGDGYGEADM